MSEQTSCFFQAVDKILPFFSYFLMIAGAFLVTGYYIRKIFKRQYKDRHDFISKFEIKTLWYTAMIWLLSFIIYPLPIVSEEMAFRIFIDLILKLIVALILGGLIYYLLRYYYPTFMNSRLKRLRYLPRYSPNTGKPMKLLTEEEEDVYLEEGMQAEEDVFSVDYDVWIDEETGYTQIEKYSGKQNVKECPKCGYQTLTVEKEELLIAPTQYASGELLKRYKCSYCSHVEKEIFTVAKLQEEK